MSQSCRNLDPLNYSDYQEVGGVRVPTRGEVRWELPEGPFTYWRGRVTSLELRDQALPYASAKAG